MLPSESTKTRKARNFSRDFNESGYTKNTHGPMSWEKLVTMLLEEVAAAVKDDTTWQGGHMSLVLGEHGYTT
jgi:hypothetical protein